MNTTILLFCAGLALPTLCAAGSIFVLPSLKVVELGNSFSLDVNVSGLSDFYAFQFDVGFEPGVLAATNISEGSLFSSLGVFFSPGSIDNTAGTITFVSDSLSGPGPGLDTDGTLATITFNAVGYGASVVSLWNVTLLDSSINTVLATTSGATVNVTPEPATWTLMCFVGAALAVRALLSRLHATR